MKFYYDVIINDELVSKESILHFNRDHTYFPGYKSDIMKCNETFDLEGAHRGGYSSVLCAGGYSHLLREPVT